LPRAAGHVAGVGEPRLSLHAKDGAVARHRGAGAGGRHDRLVAAKRVERLTDRLSRARPIPGVVRGLAAAGLRFGDVDLAAEALEDLIARLGDVSVERVAEARSHELDTRSGDGRDHWATVFADMRSIKAKNRGSAASYAPEPRGSTRCAAQERAMARRAAARSGKRLAAMSCVAMLPNAVASAGPTRAGRPIASAAIWGSKALREPPPTMRRPWSGRGAKRPS